MTTNKSNREELEDQAVRALEIFAGLKTRLLKQSVVTMAAYNRWKIAMISGVSEGLPQLMDEAVEQYRKLEEIEASLAPFAEQGFPVPSNYERPNIDEVVVREQTGDPWAEWRNSANVLNENNQSGVKNGFQR
jgi:hypothetical protein